MSDDRSILASRADAAEEAARESRHEVLRATEVRVGEALEHAGERLPHLLAARIALAARFRAGDEWGLDFLADGEEGA